MKERAAAARKNAWEAVMGGSFQAKQHYTGASQMWQVAEKLCPGRPVHVAVHKKSWSVSGQK
jgi:hypothetical protein